MKNIFFYISLSILILIYIPSLVQEGMFFDGLTYSSISKNLAEGHGNFFNPSYTKTLYFEFNEHPPLVFILQSLFFKLLGNLYITEKIYCLVTIVFSAFLIFKIWKLIFPEEYLKSFWIPIFLFLTIPIIVWTLKNNLLEGTLTLFSLISVYLILKSILNDKLYLLFFASIFIVLAFLSKGLVGIFMFSIPLCYKFFFKNEKWLIQSLILVLSSIGILFFLFFIFPELKYNLEAYFNQQLIPALKNEREVTTNNRFKLIIDLLLELSIPIVLTICFTFFIKNKTNYKKIEWKKVLLFTLIGLSASIPLLISLKQRKFYLTPSMPYFAMSFAIILKNNLETFQTSIVNKKYILLKNIGIFLIIIALLFSLSKIGRFSRDEKVIKDLYRITNHIPEGTTFSTTKTTWENWTLVAYFNRFGYYSFDCENQNKYFLINNELNEKPPKNYYLINLKLHSFKIYKKK